jgi:hypothetical protein
MKGALPSAPAKRGRGTTRDSRSERRVVEGAQASTQRKRRKLISPQQTALQRQRSGESRAPSTALRAVPLPRYRGGGKCLHSRAVRARAKRMAIGEFANGRYRRRSLRSSPFPFTARKTRKLRRRSADRRRGYCPSHANECCHSPALRARRALKRSALVCRRSAAALAGANERHRSTPARASWDPASSGVTRIWPVHSVQRVASQYRS